MPREQIQYPRTEPSAHSTTSSPSDYVMPGEPYQYRPEPLVHVGWYGPNENEFEGVGWVQLALEIDREWMVRYISQMEDHETTLFIHSEVFTRDELNKLVRVTRRARDKAHGKDE